MPQRDAEHWRKRANDARAQAETARDAWTREMLIELADRCNELAAAKERGEGADQRKRKTRH
jgi:hypothetical protein